MPGKHRFLPFEGQGEIGRAFSQGGKEPGIVRSGGNPQDSSGWQIGSSEQGSPPKSRLPYEERTGRSRPVRGTRRYYGARARGIACPQPCLALTKAA